MWEVIVRALISKQWDLLTLDGGVREDPTEVRTLNSDSQRLISPEKAVSPPSDVLTPSPR